MVRWHADWQARGEQALWALGDGGIGGERSAGHGQFVLRGPYPSNPLPAPAPGETFVSLSLYHPKQSESAQMVEGAGIAYRFELRRGWMSSPDHTQAQDGQVYQGQALRRKAVRMFAEGSVLRYPGDVGGLGGLADVTPERFTEHPVYRYGIAWPVAYQAKEITP
jgi:CRISPR type III-A-associated RAMP protein Csm4